MLPSSGERIVEMLADDALVLDVGGWAEPFWRADWVLDLMPYETRGIYGEPASERERFGEATWVRRDVCDREPWPFEDGQFEFAICSQTLEDVRDPVWVCAELNRVARAGYVEVPARADEQAYGVHGAWVGWSHHHWLVDVDAGAGTIEFVFKSAVLQGDPALSLSQELAARLTADERVQALFWEGGFEYGERIFLAPGEVEEHLSGGIAGWSERLERRGPPPEGGRLRRLLGR